VTEHQDHPDADLEGLGLDSLTDGVRATTAQWSGIVTRAARRRNRRVWRLGAAALVALVLGTTAVVLARGGDDGTLDVAAGGSGDAAYVVPPADATVLQAWLMGGSYGFQYRDDRGETLILRRYGAELGDATATMEMWRTELGAIVVDVDPFGPVSIACSNAWTSATAAGTGTGTVVTGYRGAPMTMWFQGSDAMNLVPDGHTEDPCTPPSSGELPIVASTAALRLVDQSGWDRYVAELGPVVHRIDPATGDTVADVVGGGTPATG
jgi:hypothetical protein